MRRMRKKKKNGFLIFAAIAVSLVAILFLLWIILKAHGKWKLTQVSDDISLKSENSEWQDGWILKDGQVYSYNKDILTFLFMGIDKDNEVIHSKDSTDGGQADALFLFVLNPHNKSLKVISVNRNTMTDIRIYDESGNYVDTAKGQIALQHGFGDGLEKSCEYEKEAVAKLFYNIPIHGYCAVNMDAVTELTNLLGGVDLVSIEDVYSAMQDETLGQPIVMQGEEVHLDGRKAYSYVRYRKENQEGSSDLRLARQQQFLAALAKKALTATKEDIKTPVRLYKAVARQMVTDVSIDEIAYLSGLIGDYELKTENFYSLSGETVQGEKYEEFYVDEEALMGLILEVFYEKMEDTKEME